MTVQEKYEAWLNCPAMPDELIQDLQSMSEETIRDSFYKDLSFGTGGLRGVLGAGTNRMNFFTVLQATRGLGKYLLNSFASPSCAISYDSRIHSRDFAELAASALAEMGIHVYLYSKLEPTPMLSYAVRYLHCSGGIMITASHNPSVFNGYKVYGNDGCQINPEVADQITSFISQEKLPAESLPEFFPYLDCGKITYIDDETIENYYREILSLRIKPSSMPLHVVYTPLNGAGNEPVREILRRLGHIHVDIVKEQEEPDGRFPTCPYPNPEFRPAMDLAITKTLETGADLCFATDPDSDRMGAGIRVGNEVELISGNDMGILMLDYIVRNGNYTETLPPVVITTIVSSQMVDPICRKYGIELRRVLTGFKFICEQIHFLEEAGQKKRFILGFEESYGYMSGTFVRDKDAVNAVLLLCEMAANLKSEGKTLLDRLEELRKEYGYFAQRTVTFQYDGENGAKAMSAIMSSLRGNLLDFACLELQNAERVDYLYDNTGLPSSDVLEFRLHDGAKFIIRPSGTEPKLKAYLFTSASEQCEAEKKLDPLESLVSSLCKQ